MNERFNFRFWHKPKNRYINTEKLVLNDGTYTQVGTKQMNNGTYCSYIVNEYNTSEIIPEQCTGLRDKNGKLIYENDLIKCPSGIYRIAVDDFGLWTAIYNNNPFEDVAEWGDVVKEYAFNQNNVEIEVLGNIHENADLIKVGGK